MYFHPMQEDISKLAEDEINKKIRDLTKKLGTARRMGNPLMVEQITRALSAYQDELKSRRLREIEQEKKKSQGEPDMGELINVE
jgi:hypothetical protein